MSCKLVLLISLIVFGFFLRVFNYQLRLDKNNGNVIIEDNDAPYHAMLILDYATGKNNQFIYHDERTYAPSGHNHHWVPGMEYLLGPITKTYYSLIGDRYQTQIFISLMPPIFGILTCLLFFLFSKYWVSSKYSYLSLFLFITLPYHITSSQFAVLDHHFLEFLGIIALSMSYLLNGRKRIFAKFVISFICFWTLPGFILDYLLFSIFESLFIFFDKLKLQEIKISFYSNLILFITLLIGLLFSDNRQVLRFDTLSLFHLACVASFTLFMFVESQLKLRYKKVITIFAPILLLLVLSLIYKELITQLVAGLKHVKGNQLLSSSGEFQPNTFRRLFNESFLLLTPLSLFGLYLSFTKRKDFSIFHKVILLSGTIYLVLSFLELKFYRYHLISGIVCAVVALESLFYNCKSKAQRAAIYIISIGLVISIFIQTFKFLESTKHLKNYQHYEVSIFLQHQKVFDKKDVVMAPWDYGHKIIFYSDFKNMDNPFLVAQRAQHTKDYYLMNLAQDNNVVDDLLAKYSADYILVESILPQQDYILKLLNLEKDYFTKDPLPAKYYNINLYQSLNTELYAKDGITKDNFRLVFETKVQMKIGNRLFSKAKVFQKVKGAKLLLSGKIPNAHIELNLRTKNNRIINIKKKYYSGIRLPYVAPGKNGDIVATDAYKIVIGSKTYRLKTDEDDIMNGNEVSLHDI